MKAAPANRTTPGSAPLCLCCERAPANLLGDEPLIDAELKVPVCLDCGEHLYRAFHFLRTIPGIYGCAPLGPDSGFGPGKELRP